MRFGISPRLALVLLTNGVWNLEFGIFPLRSRNSKRCLEISAEFVYALRNPRWLLGDARHHLLK